MTRRDYIQNMLKVYKNAICFFDSISLEIWVVTFFNIFQNSDSLLYCYAMTVLFASLIIFYV